jgi:acetyl esterase/lipase
MLDRRGFLKLSSLGAVAAATAYGAADDDKYPKQTFTYKKVGDFEIKADVYRPDNKDLLPVVIWIHGGALILGNRDGILRRLRDTFLPAGYALVSIDYRLAPETKLPAILEDVQDAYTWVREKGPSLFHADPRKIAVTGGSAGGYLTLSVGYRVKPRPTVLAAFWGYGDIVGDWYRQPNEFYRRQPLVTKEQAYAGIGTSPLTDGSLSKERGKFYLYCRQQGVWPELVSGFDPVQQPRLFDPFCPVLNVTPQYPPTVLVHGTIDTDVPYEQSVLMEREFKKHGIPHQLITVPNAGHGLSEGDPQLVAQAYQDAFAFVDRAVRA